MDFACAMCSEIWLQAPWSSCWDVIFIQCGGAACFLSTSDPRRSDWLRLLVSSSARGHCLCMPETRDQFTKWREGRISYWLVLLHLMSTVTFDSFWLCWFWIHFVILLLQPTYCYSVGHFSWFPIGFLPVLEELVVYNSVAVFLLVGPVYIHTPI